MLQLSIRPHIVDFIVDDDQKSNVSFIFSNMWIILGAREVILEMQAAGF